LARREGAGHEIASSGQYRDLDRGGLKRDHFAVVGVRIGEVVGLDRIGAGFVELKVSEFAAITHLLRQFGAVGFAETAIAP
jgi:hypothetical protein